MENIERVLKNSKTIAMIGVSSLKKKEDPKNLKRKPSTIVMKYMQDFGYKVIPVNPFAAGEIINCLLYTSPSPRDVEESRMPSSA